MLGSGRARGKGAQQQGVGRAGDPLRRNRIGAQSSGGWLSFALSLVLDTAELSSLHAEKGRSNTHWGKDKTRPRVQR